MIDKIELVDKSASAALNSRIANDLFSNLQNFTKKSISYALLEKLIDMIMDETIKPGFTFPNENEMCKQLGVGRSTLRETYTALMAMGFITRTKAGTTVNDNKRIITSVPLKYIFKNSELQDICEFRTMLETQSAQLAATKASEESVEMMGQIIEQMREKGAARDIEALTHLDTSFHFMIATSTGNALIKNTLAAVDHEFEQSAYSGYCLGESVILKSIDFHVQIYDAIKKRDPELARVKMHAHIKDIYGVLQRASYTGPSV